jgi:hypothetical protein
VLLLLQAHVAPCIAWGIPEHTDTVLLLLLLLLLLQAVGCDHLPLSRHVETENNVEGLLLLLLAPLLMRHFALQTEVTVAFAQDSGHVPALAARAVGRLLHLLALCLTGPACTVAAVHVRPISSNA